MNLPFISFVALERLGFLISAATMLMKRATLDTINQRCKIISSNTDEQQHTENVNAHILKIPIGLAMLPVTSRIQTPKANISIQHIYTSYSMLYVHTKRVGSHEQWRLFMQNVDAVKVPFSKKVEGVCMGSEGFQGARC